MAEEVVLNINVNGGQSIAEVKSLKEQFTEAEDALFALAGAGKEGTAEFRAAQQEAANLKERVDDINESLDDLKPEAKLGAFTKVAGGVASGFTAAAGATALFGAESEDLQKQLVKVQAAMAFSEGLKGLGDLGDGFKVLKTVILANPLFLIVGVVTAIGTALFALRDKIGFVGKAFDALGDTMGFVIDKIKEFTDWLGISDFKAEEVKNNTIKRNEELIVSNDKKYDAEIRAAKRAGEFTEELEIVKAKAAMEANQAIIDSLDKRVDEEAKRIQELKDINWELYQTILDLDDAKNDRLRANREKASAEAQALKEQQEQDAADEAIRAEEELTALVDAAQAEQERTDAIDAKNEEKRLAKIEREKADAEEKKAKRIADEEDFLTRAQAAELEREQAAEEEEARKRKRQEDTINGIQALSDSVFTLRMLKAKKGSAEETR